MICRRRKKKTAEKVDGNRKRNHERVIKTEEERG
jgi:hypothetical protein